MPRILLSAVLTIAALAVVPPAEASSLVCVTVLAAGRQVRHCDPTGTDSSFYACPTVYSPAYDVSVAVCGPFPW